MIGWWVTLILLQIGNKMIVMAKLCKPITIAGYTSDVVRRQEAAGRSIVSMTVEDGMLKIRWKYHTESIPLSGVEHMEEA